MANQPPNDWGSSKPNPGSNWGESPAQGQNNPPGPAGQSPQGNWPTQVSPGWGNNASQQWGQQHQQPANQGQWAPVESVKFAMNVMKNNIGLSIAIIAVHMFMISPSMISVSYVFYRLFKDFGKIMSGVVYKPPPPDITTIAITQGATILTWVLSSIVMGPIIYTALKHARGESATSSEAISHIRHFPAIFVCSVATGICFSLGSLTTQLVQMSGINENLAAAAGMPLNLLGLVVAFPFIFAGQAAVDQNLGGFAALSESLRLVKSNIANVLLLAVLYFVAATVGMVLCCVGTFLTWPLVAFASAHSYTVILREKGPRP